MRQINEVVSCFFLAISLGLSVSASARAQASQGETKSAIAQTTDQAVQTGKGVVHSAGEATTEVGGALKDGGRGAIRQGRGLWQGVAVPMLSGIANAREIIEKSGR